MSISRKKNLYIKMDIYGVFYLLYYFQDIIKSHKEARKEFDLSCAEFVDAMQELYISELVFISHRLAIAFKKYEDTVKNETENKKVRKLYFSKSEFLTLQAWAVGFDMTTIPDEHNHNVMRDIFEQLLNPTLANRNNSNIFKL
jgi:hypothetical protein